MKKTIQYKTTNPGKSVVKQDITTMKQKTSMIQGISVVIPVSSKCNLTILEDTLRKVKPENFQSNKFVIVGKSLPPFIEKDETFKNGITFHSFTSGKLQDAVEDAIHASEKENILLYNPENQIKSFNLNEIFMLKAELESTTKLTRFVHKESIQGKKDKFRKTSLLLGNKDLLAYLYKSQLLCATNSSFEVDYRCKKLELHVDEVTLNQSILYKKNSPIISVILGWITWFNWYFLISAKETFCKKSVPEYIQVKAGGKPIFRFLFSTVALLMFVLMPILSLDSGNSGDEDKYQVPQAERLYKYYTSFGKDKSYREVEGMESYGMSFDTFTIFIIKTFNIEKVYEARHIMNVITGWFLMLFVGLFAYRVAGWRAGLIALLLAFFSPHLLGQSFNNPKDIPFAMTYMFSLYYMLRYFQQFPNPTKKTLFMNALAIGLAISVRVGGLLLLAYLVMFSGLFFLYRVKPKQWFSSENIKSFRKFLTLGIIISLIGYIIAIFLWPYALEGPISNVKKAFGFMANFNASLHQIFEGDMIWSDKVPWYYTFKYIGITAPLSVLVGSLIYFFLVRKKNHESFWAFMLYFAFAFPILYIIYKHSNIYGGWRHALFTYPPLVTVAGLGFDALIRLMKNKYVQIGIAVVLFVLTLKPIIHTFKNHPYQYVFFNELVGGVNGAYGKYELDYYFHSLKEGSEWVLKNTKAENQKPGQKIKVAAWLINPLIYYFRHDTARFELVFTRYYERGNDDWDYAIFVNTGINPIRLQNGTWPPANTIHTINVDGKPICAILKRNDKNDMLAYQASQKNDIPSAIEFYKRAIGADGKNETALLNLSEIYLRTNQPDSASIYLNQLLKFDPDLDNALNFEAFIHLSKNEFDKTIEVANKIIKNNHKYYFAYWWAANAKIRQNDANGAIKYLEQLLEQNQGFKPAYQMLAQIYQQMGDMSSAEKYMSMAQQLP